MNVATNDALIAHLALSMVMFIDTHATVGNIKHSAVDLMLDDVYDILNDLDEVICVTES